MTTPAISQIPSEDEFIALLLSADRLAVQGLFANIPDLEQVMAIIEGLIVPALEKIGQRWESGELSLSQIYVSGRICEDIVDSLLPDNDPQRINQPTLAITVLDDFHLLGKRMVAATLRASGYNLIDYGRMQIDEIVDSVKRDRPDILLISVLMLPSALRIKELRQQLEALDQPIKLVVGGAPFRFDPQLWQEVGADAYGNNASDVVAVIRNVLGGTNAK
jgi:methanogenic corrinoid protein MtbC1